MSLVIAIKDKDRVVIGADKQGSTGDMKDHTSTKIWQMQDLPGAIMGSVGCVRASQIIQYASVIDRNLIGDDGVSTDFVVCSLAPTIAAGLKANGVIVEASENGSCELMPNSFIFAYGDSAWMIWNDLSVTELDDYFAIGSGSDVAKGALFATEGKDPFERIVLSIDAAAESTLFVDNGIDLLVTKEHKDDVEKAAKALGYKIVKEQQGEQQSKAGGQKKQQSKKGK